MMNKSVMLMFVGVLVVVMVGDANGCQYWCKKPDGARYCCGLAERVYVDPQPDKPGICPPVRDSCPPTRFGPEVCPFDTHCPGTQKCCFDTCLDHHVCKTVKFTG